MVIRSPAAGNSIIPPTENNASGKTSVVARPARTASASCPEPGVAAPGGVNASEPTPPRRSAMVRTPMMDRRMTAPWRNRAGPSMTTEP